MTHPVAREIGATKWQRSIRLRNGSAEGYTMPALNAIAPSAQTLSRRAPIHPNPFATPEH